MLDSNLVIYAARPEYPGLRRLIAASAPAVSAVTKVEVLGYHQLASPERAHFEAFFAAAEVLPLNDAVVARAVSLRQCGRCRSETHCRCNGSGVRCGC